VVADIPAADGAEQGVAQGMGHDIGVGVAGQSHRMGDGHPAEHQGAAGDKAMGVEAVSDPEPRRGRIQIHDNLRQSEVLRAGDFQVRFRSFDDGDLDSRPFQQRGLVSRILAPCQAVGQLQQCRPHRLGGLGLPQTLSIDGRQDDPVGIDLFQGILDRDGGDGGAMLPCRTATAVSVFWSTNGRAPSWTSTISIPSSRWASPARTESCLRLPPAQTVSRRGSSP